MSATLATRQDQVLFQPKSVLPMDTTQVTNPRNGSNPQWGDPCHTMSAQGHVPSVAYAISGNIIGRDGKNGGNHLGIEDDGAMFTLTTADRHVVCMASSQANAETIEECCPTQASRQHKDPPIVALSNGDDVCGALCARDYKGVGNQYVTEGKLVCTEYAVRRLMPVECERLQGFPDGWTDLGGTSDAPRYKALGNSMAVPVMRWIGERIASVENL